MKGIIKVEFILGVVIFAVIIFYVASQINTAFISVNIDTHLDILKSRSVSVLEILIKDPDRGLASEPGIIDTGKVDAWNSTNCPTLKTDFDLGGYRLVIMEQGEPEPTLFCGYVGLYAMRTSVIRTVKFDNGNYGNMTMEMW